MSSRVRGLPGLDFGVLDDGLLVGEEVEEDHAWRREGGREGGREGWRGVWREGEVSGEKGSREIWVSF